MVSATVVEETASSVKQWALLRRLLV